MFKFYLNNTLVSDPSNWQDFTEIIERDPTIKGILPKYEQNLTFNGGGYKLLNDLYNTAGFCNLVEIRIDENCGGVYENILEGYIFLSNCKFNLNKCTVDCSVEDNNFGARIYNNKSIEIYLDSTLSKNLVAIPAAITKNVTFFRPSNGLDIVGLRKVYPVWYCFKYFIDFISDGNIDFESSYLHWNATQVGNPQRKLALTTGAILRNLTGSASPFTSFDSLFKEISRKYPLAFTIKKQSNGRPLIKIENENYFFGSDSGLKINNIQDLQQSISEELLYSEIEIGGTTATYNASIHSVPDTIKMFFKTESYYYQSECNVDNKLDLTTKYICDSNIIEELVATNTSNTAYDDDIFLVEVSYSFGILGNRAIKASLLTTPATPYYYNSTITNVQVAKNFNIYADLIQYVNSNDIGFMATKVAARYFPYHSLANYSYSFSGHIIDLCSATELITYENDSASPNHDAGGNYTANSRYTAPTNGHYFFKSNLKIIVESGLAPNSPNIMIRFYLYIRKYSAANVLIDTYTVNVGLSDFYTYKVFLSAYSQFEMGGEKMFFLQAGDYVETYFSWCSVPYKSYSNAGIYNGDPTSARVVISGESATFFKTLTTQGNGVLAAGNSSNYKVETLDFERHISNSDYKILKQDLSKSITVNHDGKSNKTGWIRKSERKLYNGETKWQLISNINT